MNLKTNLATLVRGNEAVALGYVEPAVMKIIKMLTNPALVERSKRRLTI